jgi:serine/threonine protein kinase
MGSRETRRMQGKLLSNRYLLAEEIGNGGMGSVFKATDLRTGGQVAVKIPHPFLVRDPEYTERLRREAQIAASLYSPRIVRVMDLDADEGLPFLVMEYVPGETLADELRARGRLPVGEALTVGLEIARALEAAHQRGIIHRDLKPHNIKLVDGEIKVLDFGIARAEGFAGVTNASIFMGTPEYSAPERADGLSDIRSDIYSLGVMLYESLAGHLPFTGLSPIAVLRKHEREPPPPLPPDIPEDATAIVLRCLAKLPEERYQTPRDLVLDITAALRGLPLPTPLPTGEHRIHGIAPPVLPTNPAISPPAGAAVTPGSAPRTAGSTEQRTTPLSHTPAPMLPTLLGTPPDGVHDVDHGALSAEPATALLVRDERTGPGAPTVPSGTPAVPAYPATAPMHAQHPLPGAPHTESGILRTTPPRRLVLFGSGIAAAMGVGLMGVMLALSGGSDTGKTDGAASASAAPVAGAATPVAALSTAVTATPVIVQATPPRPLSVAEIPLERASGSEERNLLRTLNEANRAEVLAYRRADPTGLDAYFSGQALKEVANNIGGLKRLGRYGVSDLKSIVLVSLEIESPERATIQTREVQDYDEMITGTNEPVPELDLHRKEDTLRWTYRLIKLDSRWLIESKNFSTE